MANIKVEFKVTQYKKKFCSLYSVPVSTAKCTHMWLCTIYVPRIMQLRKFDINLKNALSMVG